MEKLLDFSPVTGIILGSLLSGVHAYMEESGVPRRNECRYFAPLSVDVGAWVVGAYLMYVGVQKNLNLVAMSGSVIATIHAAHYMSSKVLSRVLD